MAIENCLLNLSASQYLEYSEAVETALYYGRRPNFYFDDNGFEFSELYFTQLPLGTDPGDRKPLEFYRQWAIQMSASSLELDLKVEDGHHYQCFELLQTHPVYLEFSGNSATDDSWFFKTMNQRIEKHLKSFSISKNSQEYDPFVLRFYGIIALFANRYLNRRSGKEIVVIDADKHKDLERAINKVLGALKQIWPLESEQSREHMIGNLISMRDYNKPSSELANLYPTDRSHGNTELVATISDFLLFTTKSEGKRSPSLVLDIFAVFDQALTPKVVKGIQTSMKAYVLDHKINRRKILLNHAKPAAGVAVAMDAPDIERLVLDHQERGDTSVIDLNSLIPEGCEPIEDYWSAPLLLADSDISEELESKYLEDA